ncbi:MAG: S-layer homology domain-containing protein, partial [Oscillospiraceae bacterium]
MRNLKKVLSLTLALVMMLGMMTFAGAAETTKKLTSADLTDMDKVVNKEAVSLLVDLQVIGGRETGAFDPTSTLTRGEIAKMIYVAKMGTDNAANFVGAPTGLLDVKGHWAEGYINYCFSTGIVSGKSKTSFDPDGKVLTAEAAKMLLVALGYDAENEGYLGDLWAVNVMQDAKKVGLMEGVGTMANVHITR